MRFGYSYDEIQHFEREIHHRLERAEKANCIVKAKTLEGVGHILSILKTNKKSHWLYVSVGLGIDLDSATEIVGNSLVHSVAEPIRVVSFDLFAAIFTVEKTMFFRVI